MKAVVVLAAGASSRMGRPKALLQVPGPFGQAETWLGRITRLCRAAGAGAVVVAIGPPHGEVIRAASARGPDAGLVFAENPDPARGMLTSVQAAVRVLPAEVTGTLVWPVDMPLVREATVAALLALAENAPGQGAGALIVPAHGGRCGHPLWVGCGFFAALLSLPPAAGLRQLRLDHPAAVRLLDGPDAGILRDLDTPADLSQARPDLERL